MRVLSENYKVLLIALMAFFSLYPYFIWGYYGFVVLGLLGFYLSSSFLVFNFSKISTVQVFIFLSIFITYLLFNIKQISISVFLWSFAVAFFSSLSNKEVVKSFYVFRKIIVYLLFPGAFLWFFHILVGNNSYFHFYNIEPFNPVKIEYKISFYSYIFSVIPNYDVPSGFYRFCGLFEEPGVVGTICSLLLVADRIDLKSNENKLLFFYGLISFSLAFYIIVIIYYLLFIMRNIKGIFSVFFLSFILYLFFLLSSSFRILILSRLSFSSQGGFSGNNRTTPYLDNLFDNWLYGDLNVILFGYTNVVNDGYSSIKQIPVENGLIGVFSVTFLVSILILKSTFFNINKYNLFFLCLIFLVSLYQRPDFYFLYFILVFSFAFINHSNNREFTINR